MILPIRTYGSRVLRAKAKPVKADEPVIRLVMDMFETMHAASGIGLAANQVGKLQRVIVVDISDIEEDSGPSTDQSGSRTDESERMNPVGKSSESDDIQRRFKSHPPIALVNPEVISSDGAWSMEEGCLSIPGVRDAVERAEKIRVRYKDASLRETELEAGGLLARVILHEIDHLNGVLFIDRLTPEKRKTHKEELKKIQRGEFEVEYPIVNPAARVEAE